VLAELREGDPLLVDIRETEERVASGVIPGRPCHRGMLEFYADRPALSP